MSEERKRLFQLHVPISIDCIEPNLYISNLNAATDLKTLAQYKITHIVTIDTCPLPRLVTDIETIECKYIGLADLPSEDLLSHFDDTYEFITVGLEKGAVLVHCLCGVSRSATVVLAYLMRRDGLSVNEALKRVRSQRPVCPNQGFISQLTLYKEMGYKVDKNHVKYKVFRLGKAAAKVKKAKILPRDYYDLIKPDPGLTQVQPEPNVYRCKRCRRIVAAESNLLTHFDRKETNHIMCRQTYFIEPLAWMGNITQCTEGKLHCPKCDVKLGSFSWIMGALCPCGCQVAPAFYLVPSKIDWTNVVKNVEITV